MEKTNLENLNKLAKLFGTDRLISPEEVQEIRGVLVGVLANNKKELESLTAETRELVNKVLNKILDEHDTYLEKTKQIAQEAKSDTTEAIQATMKSLEEVKKLCKEVMDCKPENGKDADEEYVIGEVLNRIKLPEYKEVVLDDGGAIVDKINSLPVNEENQIDAKHIKNLPEVKGGRVISGGVTRKIVEQMIEAAGGGGSQNLQQVLDTGNTATESGSGNTMELDHSGSGDTLVLNHSGSGNSLQVNGKAVVTGNLTVDTDTLFVDATNNRLGIGTTSPAQALHVSSATTYQGIFVNGSVAPNISFAQSAGTTAEWKAGISGNAGTSFSISSGASATDRILINSSGFVGLNTNTNPTHTLTLASTSTGIALYNTADQTTNYERGLISWASNILTIATGLGGTGTARAVRLTAVGSGSNGTFTVNRGALPLFEFSGGSTATTSGNIIDAVYTNTASSGTITMMRIAPTINQSSTAGYTALLVNPTETTTGSGTKLLADFQVGGSSKFSVSNGGVITNVLASGGTNLISTSSGSVAATVGIEFRYSSAGANTNLARIMSAVESGGGGGLTFDTAAGGGSAYTTKMTLTRAGDLFLSANLELGNASDTTISRSSAGVIAVEGVVIPSISSTNTLTNKRITSRVQAVTSSATVTPSWDNDDAVTITAQAAGLTLANPSGTPTSMQRMVIRIKDNGTAQTIAYGAGYRAIGVTLPTTTVISKTLYLGGFWNAADSKFDITAYAQEA